MLGETAIAESPLAAPQAAEDGDGPGDAVLKMTYKRRTRRRGLS